MWIVVGLGNIGEKYQDTRHNVGFVVVEKIASKLELEWEKKDKFEAEVAQGEGLVLVKPHTYMNSSGRSVRRIADFFKVGVASLIVVHDDLDIRLAESKIQVGKGPKVHNGVSSVEECMGNGGFWRVRVGVDNRDAKARVKGEEYVLGSFRKDEREVIERVAEEVASEILKMLQ